MFFLFSSFISFLFCVATSFAHIDDTIRESDSLFVNYLLLTILFDIKFSFAESIKMLMETIWQLKVFSKEKKKLIQSIQWLCLIVYYTLRLVNVCD